MELQNIPEAFQSAVRLSVLTVLMLGAAEFTELRNIAKTTDGNLSTHLRKLEADGYVEIRKGFKGRKPNTVVTITQYGREQFKEYVQLLQSCLGDNSADQ